MDNNLNTVIKIYEKMVEDNNYVINTPEEQTAMFNFENDPMYGTLYQEVKAADSYEVALGILNGYVKEAEFSKEELNMDDALREDVNFDKIIADEMTINGLTDDLQTVKSNIVRYYNDRSKIEEIENPIEKQAYEKLVDAYEKEKNNELDNKNTNVRNLVYTNPDLNNSGHVNLILLSFLLSIVAFIVFLIINH